jgi:hypothetical protein
MTPNPKTMREILKQLLEQKDKTITEAITEIKGLMLTEDEIFNIIDADDYNLQEMAREIHSAQMEKLK